jgi:hypothetical protein
VPEEGEDEGGVGDTDLEGESDEAQFGMGFFCNPFFRILGLIPDAFVAIERLKGIWRSPMYGLYQDKVEIGYEGPRKYHLFTCANPKCRLSKNHKRGTVRRYLDSKDRSATGNLLTHARTCRGREAVDSVLGGASQKPKGKRDGSIYSAFARMGSKVARFCHKPQTAQETRYIFYFGCLVFILTYFF